MTRLNPSGVTPRPKAARPPVRAGPGDHDFADRLSVLRPQYALALIISIGALILLGLSGNAQNEAGRRNGAGDAALYVRIIDDVRSGESYYLAAVREQRSASYPLRPFVAVRPPTLAVTMAALPNESARRLSIWLLAVVTFLAWSWRFKDLRNRPICFGAALFILSTGITPAFSPGAYAMHEFWAGLLIALSLALHGPRRWLVSLLVGLLAVCVRELAAPYLLAMAVLAWREGGRAESAAWFLAIVAFLTGMSLHAAAVQPLLQSSDLASPGWLGLGGWQFLLMLLRWNIPLIAAPGWLIAIVAPLAFLGLVARGGRMGNRLALVVIGYAASFLVVGRPNNGYWGLMIAPLWPIGLIATGPALQTLVAMLRRRQQIRAGASD